MFQWIRSRSLTRADENGSGDIDISLGYRRIGSVSSRLRSYETDTLTYNHKFSEHIRRLDHSRTYTLHDIAATSLIREVATKTSKMTICHVNEIREENKAQTPHRILPPMVHLQKLITVLGNEIKCAIIQYVFYTPAVGKTYNELYVSQVMSNSPWNLALHGPIAKINHGLR